MTNQQTVSEDAEVSGSWQKWSEHEIGRHPHTALYFEDSEDSPGVLGLEEGHQAISVLEE